MPACRSLDCVSVFAPTVGAAVAAADVAASARLGGEDSWRRVAPRLPARGTLGPDGAPLRIGVPVASGLTFDGDAGGSARFDAATRALLRAGA